MKIAVIRNFNINPVQSLPFKRKVFSPSLESQNDTFNSSDGNMQVQIDEKGRLAHIDFKVPVSIGKALCLMAFSDDYLLKEALIFNFGDNEDLYMMAVDLNSEKSLEHIKVKSFIGMGVSAMAFETIDGKVLKVTDEGEHFPDNRKPDFFDVPIYQKGKSGHTRYYLEEKVDVADVTDEETEELITKIKDSGYEVKDYLSIYEHADNKYGHPFKKEQFGRAKDGTVYLIDPECAYKIKKTPIKDFIQKIRRRLFLKRMLIES